MSTDGSTNWDGAKWIGSSEYVLDAKSKPVFNITYDLQIPDGSSKAGFIFGANDPRLLDVNKNNYSIAGENYIEYKIALTTDSAYTLGSGTTTSSVLNIYRKGYGPDKAKGQLDESLPLQTFDISQIINDTNAHNKHTVKITVSGNQASATLLFLSTKRLIQ